MIVNFARVLKTSAEAPKARVFSTSVLQWCVDVPFFPSHGVPSSRGVPVTSKNHGERRATFRTRHSGLNRPKMGSLLKCTENVLLRLKFDEEHDAVGPGIVISNLGAKKCQKHAKKHIFWPKIGEKNF